MGRWSRPLGGRRSRKLAGAGDREAARETGDEDDFLAEISTPGAEKGGRVHKCADGVEGDAN